MSMIAGFKRVGYSSKSFIRCLSSIDNNMIKVTFLRHGQSTWNKENIFIGMTDTPLTNEGELEAKASSVSIES